MRSIGLYRDTFFAGIASAGIGVDEMKSFVIETIEKIQCGVDRIQKDMKNGHPFYPLVFKNLILYLQLVVETG